MQYRPTVYCKSYTLYCTALSLTLLYCIFYYYCTVTVFLTFLLGLHIGTQQIVSRILITNYRKEPEFRVAPSILTFLQDTSLPKSLVLCLTTDPSHTTVPFLSIFCSSLNTLQKTK